MENKIGYVQSVSSWYGVLTENGRVIGLNLAENNLEGELPIAFCDLIYLTTVDLHQNKLQGSLPETIHNLKDLQIFGHFG